MKNLNELAKRIHSINQKWWHDLESGKPIVRNKGELLMLVITELAEATEGIRKNLMDDKLPNRKMEEVEMADAKIRLLDYAGGFGLTLCDQGAVLYGFSNQAEHILIICKTVGQIHSYSQPGFNNIVSEQIAVATAINLIEHYCQIHNLDLDGAIEEKLEYNKTREDHSHEARKLANGKKF